MKNIRSNALHHADILHNPPGGMSRKRLEQNLIEEIRAAAEEVLRRSWNPLCWLPALSSPTILAILPPVVLFAQVDVGSKLPAVAIGINVLVIVLLASGVILNRALVRMTEALGVAISRSMEGRRLITFAGRYGRVNADLDRLSRRPLCQRVRTKDGSLLSH